ARTTRQAMIQLRWDRSISIRRLSLGDSEELQGLDAMQRIVRARVHAGRLGVVTAEVAGGGLLAHHRLAHPRLLGILGVHHERMEVDVAVRALVGAQATADAPVLDDDLQRIRVPADGAYRAADQ